MQVRPQAVLHREVVQVQGIGVAWYRAGGRIERRRLSGLLDVEDEALPRLQGFLDRVEDRLIAAVRAEAQAAGVEADLGLAATASAAEAITRIDRFVCDIKESQFGEASPDALVDAEYHGDLAAAWSLVAAEHQLLAADPHNVEVLDKMIAAMGYFYLSNRHTLTVFLLVMGTSLHR